MDVFFWAALGFIAATAAGTVFVGIRARRTWRAFVSLAVVGDAASEMLDERAVEMAAKAERAAVGADELLAALARFERTRARGRVLLDAVMEIRDTLRGLADLVPQK